jgi:hypothetical protein
MSEIIAAAEKIDVNAPEVVEKVEAIQNTEPVPFFTKDKFQNRHVLAWLLNTGLKKTTSIFLRFSAGNRLRKIMVVQPV